MPTRRKRQSTNSLIYTSILHPEQIRFKPQSRTVSTLKGSRPSKSTRQQTLTQIDFVSRGIAMEKGITMDYEELDEVPERKRRKVHHDVSPMKRVTRASAGSPGLGDAESEQSQEMGIVKSAVKTEALVTPRKTRVLEIPSSQSPPDTPFSARSIKSHRSPTRSPLKAKSTNQRLVLRRPLQSSVGNDWHPKLEVKSTLTWEREDSENSNLPTVSEGEDGFEKVPSPLRLGLSTSSETCKVNKSLPTQATTKMVLPKKAITNQQTASSGQFKSQIKDSDDEEDEGYEDCKDRFTESQEGLRHRAGSLDLGHETESSKGKPKLPSSSVHAVAALLLCDDQGKLQTTEFEPGQDTQGLLESVNLTPDIFAQDESLSVCPLDTNPATKNRPIKGQHNTQRNPHLSSSPPQSTSPQNPSSESEELAAQFSNDIFQSTQLQSCQGSLSSPIDIASSQHPNAERESSPSEPSQESYKSASSHVLHNIHPSQATTVDLTQPSRQAFQRTHNSSPHSSSPLLQTPTRMTPRRGNEKDEWEKEGSEHGMLTMSQLLPDSLMQDSLPLPPPWSQESFSDGYE
ncbi:MAG: hypothetical protein M1835_001124 [Candelina submexicana]|nr:MAG: hypothetical protein M1835_001124 [Candelina submexicana]